MERSSRSGGWCTCDRRSFLKSKNFISFIIQKKKTIVFTDNGFLFSVINLLFDDSCLQCLFIILQKLKYMLRSKRRKIELVISWSLNILQHLCLNRLTNHIVKLNSPWFSRCIRIGKRTVILSITGIRENLHLFIDVNILYSYWSNSDGLTHSIRTCVAACNSETNHITTKWAYTLVGFWRLLLFPSPKVQL